MNTPLMTLVCAAAVGIAGVAQGQYEPTWQSLSRHAPAPEWFQDAKLGVYFHWGVYCVPAYGSEWYPRHMYEEGRREHTHHVRTYGDPADHSYDKFVPDFTAEHFDAAEWAALFRRAGARFAGPVAEHHDGFAMWASDVTPWNAAERGPRRDVTGELAEAVRAEGMRLITTFHHARNNLWRKNGQWTGHYEHVRADYPSVLEDPERALLHGYVPRDEFLELWKNKLTEVVDKYQPDIVWFDSWLDEIPARYRQEFCAYYLNRADEWGREVVIVRKQDDLPIDFTVLDHEKSRTSRMSPRVWMTDDTISTGSWCYTRDLRIKPAKKVLHSIIDTVAKNGVVLLNVSPKANGEIPEDQRRVLREIGDWLDANGEAIYATRPWLTYGEGPTKEPSGGFGDAGEFLRLEYSAADVRYTRSKSGDTVYAILLGRPEAGAEVVLTAFGDGQPGAGVDVAGVTLLDGRTLTWDRTDSGLAVTLGDESLPADAVVLKIATR